MDTEQLQMLIKAIEGAGGEARTVLITWMVVDLVKVIVGWGGIMWAIVRTSRVIVDYARSTSETSAAWQQVCRASGGTRPLVESFPNRNNVEDVIQAIKNKK